MMEKSGKHHTIHNIYIYTYTYKLNALESKKIVEGFLGGRLQ